MLTRGEQMLALRRRRMAAAPPFLRGGFRPFFLGGPAWAIVALTVWLVTLASGAALPSAFDPVAWHRHEMLFGFVGAVIAGFLLTAVPNWTGRLPIAGAPLATLFALWVFARTTVLFSATAGLAVAAALDVGFFLILALLAAREVVDAGNRNLPVVGLILLFGLVDALDYAAAAGIVGDRDIGWKAGVGLVILLISIIGGRIVPSFTRNWLAKQGVKHGLPGQPNSFDLVVIAVTALALFFWVLAPQGWVTGTIFVAAATGQALRLARWAGWRTLPDSLVLVIHVGYAWVPVGLALLAAVNFGAPLSRSAGIHALTAGAMATMILAVMTRATLGHTGRELRANVATRFIYLLVTGGAVLRVGASLNLVDYRLGLDVAGAAWIGAFLLFLAVYGPMLVGPRVDGKP